MVGRDDLIVLLIVLLCHIPVHKLYYSIRTLGLNHDILDRGNVAARSRKYGVAKYDNTKFAKLKCGRKFHVVRYIQYIFAIAARVQSL